MCNEACSACEKADAEIGTKCGTCHRRHEAWKAGNAYEYSPEDCPHCKGQPLPPISKGTHSCNLCGNTSRVIQ